MEKLKTCNIFKEKSFATKSLQRTRKTREVILQTKWISNTVGELQMYRNLFRNMFNSGLYN